MNCKQLWVLVSLIRGKEITAFRCAGVLGFINKNMI